MHPWRDARGRSVVEGQWDGRGIRNDNSQCGDTDQVSSHGITPLKWMRRDTTGNWNSTRKQGKSGEIYRCLVGHGRIRRDSWVNLIRPNFAELRSLSTGRILETNVYYKNVECNTLKKTKKKPRINHKLSWPTFEGERELSRSKSRSRDKIAHKLSYRGILVFIYK